MPAPLPSEFAPEPAHMQAWQDAVLDHDTAVAVWKAEPEETRAPQAPRMHREPVTDESVYASAAEEEGRLRLLADKGEVALPTIKPEIIAQRGLMGYIKRKAATKLIQASRYPYVVRNAVQAIETKPGAAGYHKPGADLTPQTLAERWTVARLERKRIARNKHRQHLGRLALSPAANSSSRHGKSIGRRTETEQVRLDSRSLGFMRLAEHRTIIGRAANIEAGLARTALKLFGLSGDVTYPKTVEQGVSKVREGIHESIATDQMSRQRYHTDRIRRARADLGRPSTIVEATDKAVKRYHNRSAALHEKRAALHGKYAIRKYNRKGKSVVASVVGLVNQDWAQRHVENLDESRDQSIARAGEASNNLQERAKDHRAAASDTTRVDQNVAKLDAKRRLKIRTSRNKAMILSGKSLININKARAFRAQRKS